VTDKFPVDAPIENVITALDHLGFQVVRKGNHIMLAQTNAQPDVPKKGRRLSFRFEVVRAGFKKDRQERDYATIIAVARKIPEDVLQEDPKLLMGYDQAVTRMGGE